MKLMMKLSVLFFGVLMLGNVACAQSPREELQQMVEQLQTSPNDNALREKIIKLAPTLKPSPAMPDAAITFEGRAQFAFRSAKSEDDFLAAAQEYEKAVAAAPWVLGYYTDLCTIYEKAGKFEDAKRHCGFYLIGLTDPAQMTDVKRRIAGLEFGIEKAEEKRDRKKAEGAAERFVGTWSRSVMGGDRNFHRQWFTLSRDGIGLKMSGQMTEVPKPPYDIIVRGGELEFKLPYTLGKVDGSIFERAVAVVVFTLSADGRRMISRQTFLPYTPAQQEHWKNWPDGPGDSFGPKPWTKD